MNIGKNHYYSISKKLLKEKVTNEQFESILNSLTLEQIIALKLELSSRIVKGKLFGFPIFKAIDHIIKDSLVKFSLSATKSQKEAAAMLGITVKDLRLFCKKYNPEQDLD